MDDTSSAESATTDGKSSTPTRLSRRERLALEAKIRYGKKDLAYLGGVQQSRELSPREAANLKRLKKMQPILLAQLEADDNQHGDE